MKTNKRQINARIAFLDWILFAPVGGKFSFYGFLQNVLTELFYVVFL